MEEPIHERNPKATPRYCDFGVIDHDFEERSVPIGAVVVAPRDMAKLLEHIEAQRPIRLDVWGCNWRVDWVVGRRHARWRSQMGRRGDIRSLFEGRDARSSRGSRGGGEEAVGLVEAL